MKVDIINTVSSYVVFKCPNCGEKLRTAYIANTVLCCEKCNKVYSLNLNPEKITIKQIKEDGWLK